MWSSFRKFTGWLLEETTSFRNSSHCTVWTQQLVSVKDKQMDNRERGEKNVGDMKICEGAREQSRTCEKCSSVFLFFIALLWQHVWNWNVIRCEIWYYLLRTCTRTRLNTVKTVWLTQRYTQSLLCKFSSNLLMTEWCDTARFLKLSGTFVCSLSPWPIRIKHGIKYDCSSLLQLETCESLRGCGGV